MNLECSVAGISHLSSRSQQVRILTEAWFGRNGYCISCSSDHLSPTKPNTIAHDFLCEVCGQTYELKSRSSPEGKRVVDGAYATMVKKIREGNAPSLILLQYNRELLNAEKPWMIQRLIAVHPIFLTEIVIEARNKLSPTARRAGWQGCNIRLDRVPDDGRIEIVTNSQLMDKGLVRRRFASVQKLAGLKTELRGWAGLTLSIVRRLGSPFNLHQVYAERSMIEEAFPDNRNIEAKLRQQLQLLRDFGIIEFLGHGSYAITDR